MEGITNLMHERRDFLMLQCFPWAVYIVLQCLYVPVAAPWHELRLNQNQPNLLGWPYDCGLAWQCINRISHMITTTAGPALPRFLT